MTVFVLSCTFSDGSDPKILGVFDSYEKAEEQILTIYDICYYIREFQLNEIQE